MRNLRQTSFLLLKLLLQIDFKKDTGSGEIQQLRMCTAFPEVQNSVPSTYMESLTTAYNANSRGTQCPLLDCVGTAHTHMNVLIYRHTYTQS